MYQHALSAITHCAPDRGSRGQALVGEHAVQVREAELIAQLAAHLAGLVDGRSPVRERCGARTAPGVGHLVIDDDHRNVAARRVTHEKLAASAAAGIAFEWQNCIPDTFDACAAGRDGRIGRSTGRGLVDLGPLHGVGRCQLRANVLAMRLGRLSALPHPGIFGFTAQERPVGGVEIEPVPTSRQRSGVEQHRYVRRCRISLTVHTARH
ncbi:unannotated protein [freshwater metagenome]|uniref:Unannotated protein n=1 Tax=freshwater metagenome TaxID=449393 RepID=A0A6J7IX05_9ZZZZ